MRRSAQIQPIVHRVWRESSSACGFKRDSPNFDRPMTAVLKLSASPDGDQEGARILRGRLSLSVGPCVGMS